MPIRVIDGDVGIVCEDLEPPRDWPGITPKQILAAETRL